MKSIFITISILVLALNIFAQETCDLALNDAPTLHNLKLGMSPAEATNALNIKVKAKQNGQRTFFKNYIKNKAKGNLSGIRAMYLRFYDGRLYQIEFFYEENSRFPSLETLLEDYSANANFPKKFWQTEHGYATADCQGFALKADYVLNPHIQLTDTAQTEMVEKERAKNKLTGA